MQSPPEDSTISLVHRQATWSGRRLGQVHSPAHVQWMIGLSGDKQKKIIGMSSVDKLDPFLVDGISRVGRRQKRVLFGSETKYPIILPKFSHFTHLIVGDFHVKCDHCGLKHTLAALCRIYWGNGYCASKILTSVLLKDSKAWKLMAELPNSRLQLSLPPFAHIGVHYFGSLLVRHRCSEANHHWCLFTCMATRPVHHEVVRNWCTDALIIAIRCFVAGWSSVEHIYSDKGNSLVGTERMLCQTLNQDQIYYVEKLQTD